MGGRPRAWGRAPHAACGRGAREGLQRCSCRRDRARAAGARVPLQARVAGVLAELGLVRVAGCLVGVGGGGGANSGSGGGAHARGISGARAAACVRARTLLSRDPAKQDLSFTATGALLT
jgi:hypothetical protein